MKKDDMAKDAKKKKSKKRRRAGMPCRKTKHEEDQMKPATA